MSLFDAPVAPLEAGRGLADVLSRSVAQADLAFSFPDLGVAKSTRFIREYYRGLEFLNQVLERTYERNGSEIRAFLVSGKAETMPALVASFAAFFADEGIVQQSVTDSGLTYYKVRDPYEGEWFYLPLKQHLIGVFTPLDDGIAAQMQAYARGLR